MISKDIMKEKFKAFLEKLIEVFTQRLPIKIICVFAAFLIFLYVRYEQEDAKEYIAKISLKNKPSNLVLANELNENINVTIKGFKDQLVNLPQELNAYIDLTNAFIGSNVYPLHLEEFVENNNKIRVIFSPRVMSVVLDEVAYKSVPITSSTVGTPAFGVIIDNILLTPSNTIISGPKNMVSSITELKTFPIDLTDKFEDYSIMQNIRVPSLIKSDITQVDAAIIFNKNIVKREYTNIAVEINKLNSRFQVKANGGFIVESIILEASESIINNITSKDISLSLNLSDISKPGTYSNRFVEVELPSQVKMVSIYPSSFVLEVEESK